MDQDFVRLGKELKAAREQRRPRMTQPEAAAALGVGRSTIQKMESEKAAQVTPTTVRSYARLLGWTDDSVDRVLAGGDPVMAGSSAEAPAATGEPLGLTPEVEYELRSGETLGSQVISLGPEEEDGHIIVVLKGKKGLAPEKVQRILERYGRARPRLQGLAADVDEVADS
ncbi:helix-turn-helix domain-containing protein [Streptomyces tricolor]|uniref:helix-turn-helix domain-containing protein n=1 Tax=Streptomyces tricolor TaxID=68277 RepID=UPI0037F8F279